MPAAGNTPARKIIHATSLPKVKVYHEDLKQMGIVTSRYDQHQKIRQGKLRPPNKNSDSMQAAAWWWWDDIVEDLERERNSAKAG